MIDKEHQEWIDCAEEDERNRTADSRVSNDARDYADESLLLDLERSLRGVRTDISRTIRKMETDGDGQACYVRLERTSLSRLIKRLESKKFVSVSALDLVNDRIRRGFDGFPPEPLPQITLIVERRTFAAEKAEQLAIQHERARRSDPQLWLKVKPLMDASEARWKATVKRWERSGHIVEAL